MRKPPLSMSSAAADSLWATRSRSAPSRTRMSSSMSWGRVNMSGGPAGAFVDELVQQHAGDHVQGFEDTLALVGARGEGRHHHFAVVEEKLEVFERRGVGDVALVILDDEGDVGEVLFEGADVLLKVGEAFHVFLHFVVLRISDEHNAVHAAEHQLAGGVVDHLAGHGVKLKLGAKSLDRHRLDWQEVEEERSVGTRRKGDELALVLLQCLHI